jgi:hypothetical protein
MKSKNIDYYYLIDPQYFLCDVFLVIFWRVLEYTGVTSY